MGATAAAVQPPGHAVWRGLIGTRCAPRDRDTRARLTQALPASELVTIATQGD
jgi:hypothetical protein|eukprot:COSAG06_NODE_492_length_15074_cov_26.658564_15_plen_53_part_00